MQKICSKNYSHNLFNFGKYLRQLMHAKDLKISYFKRHHGKGNLVFSFAPSFAPSHFSFYGQDYEKGGL